MPQIHPVDSIRYGIAGLFSGTGKGFVDPVGYQFDDDVGRIDATPDPTERAKLIAALQAKMGSAGYDPVEAGGYLGARGPIAVQETQSPGGAAPTAESAARAATLNQMLGRTLPARDEAPMQSMQRGAAATESLGNLDINKVRAAAYEAAQRAQAGKSTKQGNLADTRAADIGATQGPRIDVMQARRDRLAGTGAQALTLPQVYELKAKLASRMVGRPDQDQEALKQLRALDAIEAGLRGEAPPEADPGTSPAPGYAPGPVTQPATPVRPAAPPAGNVAIPGPIQGGASATPGPRPPGAAYWSPSQGYLDAAGNPVR